MMLLSIQSIIKVHLLCSFVVGFRVGSRWFAKDRVQPYRYKSTEGSRESRVRDGSNDAQSKQHSVLKRTNQFNTTNFDAPEIADDVDSKFGLRNDQLRELQQQPLPLPREVISSDDKQVFSLPELTEFVRDNPNGGSKSRASKGKAGRAKGFVAVPQVDRRNQEEYTKVLKLNPFADADTDIFVEEYDIFQSVFGMGTLLSVPVPYLQSGHLMLLFVSLLAALVYAPGNPLTEFPVEVRAFLQQGLKIVFSINTVLAVQAYIAARKAQQSGTFWFVKVFLLGGIASYELSELEKKKSKSKPK